MSRVPITEELVEHLRALGADKDTIEFTERHVTRYSQADLDRVQARAIGLTLLVVGIVVFVVASWPR